MHSIISLSSIILDLHEKKKINKDIYDYIKNYINEEIKKCGNKVKLNFEFQWNPKRHIKLMKGISKIEKDNGVQIIISSKYKNKDTILNTVKSNLCTAKIILMGKQEQEEIPNNVKMWISNFKKQFEVTKMKEINYNDLIFEVRLLYKDIGQ